MEKVLKYLYYFSILCFALPSGSILGIPIKLLVTFSLLGLFFVWCLIENKNIVVDPVIVGFVFILVMLWNWGCIGSINGYETVFACFKSFLSLLITVLSTYLVIKNKIVSIEKSIKIIYWTAIFIVLVKFICETILVLGIMEWNQFRQVYGYITGTAVTTMQIPLGGLVIYRIMATNDFLPLVLLGFYLIFEKKSFVKKGAVVLLLGIYTFIVYSRVAMVQYGVIVLLYMASLLWDLIRNTTRGKMIIFVVIAFLSIGIVSTVLVLETETIISYVTTLTGSLYERWFGNSAAYSDSFRDEQSMHLWAGIKETPILGQGLGSYVRGYLRSEELPFSYEAEYLSFLYQFGFVGFVTIVGGIICLFARICFKDTKGIRLNILLLINFGIWALRPIYNPQFLSSSSGMIIVALFLAGGYYSQKLKIESKGN